MKIANIQRFNRVIGGRERYASELCNLLESKGNFVVNLALTEPEMFPPDTSQHWYLGPHLEVQSSNIISRLKAASFRLYNPNTANILSNVISEEGIDIIHTQTLHHISTSIIQTAYKYHVPLVLTLHDYQVVCPNNILFTRGDICNRCNRHHFYHAVLNRCNQGSLSHSMISALDTSLLRMPNNIQHIDTFIAPTIFTKNKVIEHGIPPEKVIILPGFAPLNKWSYSSPMGKGNILLISRLYRQKGVHIFLEALKLLHLPSSQKVIIAGDGPEMDNLQEQAAQLHLDNILFTGFLTDDELHKYILECSFAVVPSIWYEVMGYAILEPFTIGRPVVASNIGGIPEIVSHNVNGRLASANDAGSLALQIDWMLTHTIEVVKMGRNARETVEKQFSPEQHYAQLIQIYKNAISRQSF